MNSLSFRDASQRALTGYGHDLEGGIRGVEAWCRKTKALLETIEVDLKGVMPQNYGEVSPFLLHPSSRLGKVMPHVAW
jgi:hypothetical protein